MFIKVPLAWLQLTHHKDRFIVALAGVAFAVILMFMQLGFKDALYRDAITIHKTFRADLILISPKSISLFGTSLIPRHRLYEALSVDGVVTASPLYLGGGQWKNPQNQSTTFITILAFNPDKPIFNLAGVNGNLDTIRRTDIVLFDRLSRLEFGPIVTKFSQGQSISTEVNNRKIEVGGLFSLGGGILSADGLLVTSDLNLSRISGDNLSEMNLGLLTVETEANLEQIRRELTANLPKDIKVMTKQEFLDFEQSYWKTSSPIGLIFSIGLLMGLFVGSVIVYQILYTDITNHLAEYATLKAMGYADWYLLKVVLQEALLLAALGFIPGLIISIGLYDITKSAARLPMTTNFGQTMFIFSLTALMCFTSGMVAIQKLRAVDPADIF